MLLKSQRCSVMVWKLFFLCEDQSALTQIKELEVFYLKSNVPLFRVIATV